MDMLYYRKIAELVVRDGHDEVLHAAANRVLVLPHTGSARIKKADKRLLKDWMRAWCDQHAPKDEADGSE